MITNYLEDILIIKKELKHLSGQHDQSTHGNRFRTIAGKPRLVHVGGKRGKIEYDKEGKPITPSTDLPPVKTYDPYETSQNPPPLDFIKTPKATLGVLQENMKLAYEKKSKDLGMSVEEYAQKLDEHAQNLMKDAVPFMKIRGSALTKVLNEGRFKSQFETNTSGGLLDRHARADAEYDLFGYSTEKTAVEKRPIYGYFADNPKGKLNEYLDGYGEISVRLKPHVKETSTVTMSDSLGAAPLLMPKPANHADRMIFKAASYGSSNPLKYKKLEDIIAYPEAQYHNGLSATDIDHVVLPKYKKVSSSLLNKLTKMGIPYSYED